MGYGSLKSHVAGFCWSSEIANVWVRCCWVSRLFRLVMGLVEIGMGHNEVNVSGFLLVSPVLLGFCCDAGFFL